MTDISVIIPVYNAEEYLHKCIEHILQQCYTDFELILVNDGSTDSSLTICQEYAVNDSRIRIVDKVKNEGAGSARNSGLQIAKGTWICFCDADDYVDRNYLSLFMEHCSFEDTLIVQGINLVIKGNVSLCGLDYDGSPCQTWMELLKRPMPGACFNKLFNREIIEKHQLRFDTSIHFREDEEFILRYFLHIKNVKCVKNGCYYYNVPDLEKKYSGYDNFQCHLSCFCSTVKMLYYNFIGGTELIKYYLEELTCSFFYSFSEPYSSEELKERYRQYRKAVLPYMNLLPPLSSLSEFVIKHIGNAQIATAFFTNKHKLSNLFSRQSSY